jgi:hypothetical protein
LLIHRRATIANAMLGRIENTANRHSRFGFLWDKKLLYIRCEVSRKRGQVLLDP